MKQVHAWVGISRQAEYQYGRRQARRQQAEAVILRAVRTIRQQHPRLGVRKLGVKLAQQGLGYGRDRLFALLGQANLLIRRKRRYPRTTQPGDWRAPNHLAETVVTRPNQAWVSDITYLRSAPGFCYLVLITDVYSRRIMGMDVSRSLSADGVRRALRQAVQTAGTALPKGLLFHSDHGIQYTCHAFRTLLRHHQMQPSMGAIGNCYENAVAERMNGILKQEYGLYHRFQSLRQAAAAVRQAIHLYNQDRPHLSLNFKTPHQQYLDCSSINLVH